MLDSHTRFASPLRCSVYSLLSWFVISAIFMAQSRPAVAQNALTPVHLRVLGHEVHCSTPALSDGQETYAPLDILAALSIEGKVDENQDAVTVTVPVLQKQTEIALARPRGRLMLALSDLARFLNAVVLRPDYVGPDGIQIKGRQGDVVYFLAKVTDVHIADGELHINTSFPVPYHVRMVSDIAPLRGFIDCMGVWVGENFRCAAPNGDSRALKLRAGQNDAEIARIVVEMAPGSRVRPADILTNSSLDIAMRMDGGAANPGRINRNTVTRPAAPVRVARNNNDDDSTSQEGAKPENPPSDPVVRPTTTRIAIRDNSAPIEVRGVSLHSDQPGIARLEVATSGHAISYVRYEQDGRQLVVEVNNAVLNLEDAATGEQTFQHPLITGLHTETGKVNQTNQTTTRVILDMKRVVGFNVNTQDDHISVEMRLPVNATGALSDKLIVVDPGHGGTSTGAHGAGNGVVYEKDVTLAISLKLRAALEALGAKVVMTRDRDVNVDLSERPQMANRIHADLFVSIHNDSNGVPNSASGTSTYYHMHDSNCRALAACVQHEILKVSGLPNRGILSDSVMYASGFAVLRESHMPAILVEVAYINNSFDRSHLTDPDFQERIAKAISRGLKQYVEGTSDTASNPLYIAPTALLTASSGDTAALSH